MKLISRLRSHCFCAFCKAERRIYVKKHVDLTNVGGAIVLSALIAQALYGQPDPRALLLFCVFMVAAEIFVYMRWRSAIICKLCGFDPVLYKRSPERAASRVREFYNEHVDTPEFHLTRSPLLELQKRKKAGERRAQSYQFMTARAAALKAHKAQSSVPVESPAKPASGAAKSSKPIPRPISR